jgi:hypothetical protein
MNGVVTQVASGMLVLAFAAGLFVGKPQFDRRLPAPFSTHPAKVAKVVTANLVLTDRVRRTPETVW